MAHFPRRPCILLLLALAACSTIPEGTFKADPEGRQVARPAGSEPVPADTAVCDGGPVKPPAGAQTGRYKVRGYTADRSQLRFFLEPRSGGQGTIEVEAESELIANLLLRNDGAQIEVGLREREGCVAQVVFLRSQ
jgi:hypothetical protein